MTAARVYVKTGERFSREDIGDFTSPGSPLASGETANKIYVFPTGSNNIIDFNARKSLDSGSMKILVNNVSHLCYQKCRTLATIVGPGRFEFLKQISPWVNQYQAVTGITQDSERFRDIGWNPDDSIKLGPFPAIMDRVVENPRPISEPYQTAAAGARCMRKLVMVIRGFKNQAETVPRFYICGTEREAASPANPSTSLFQIDASERAWIELIGTSSVSTPPVPWSPVVAHERQGWQHYMVDWQLIPSFTGEYRLYIPVSFLTDITTTNEVRAQNAENFEYFVWLGWNSEDDQDAINSVTLLEVRDIGSAEADANAV
jgi:hypothetical protein